MRGSPIERYLLGFALRLYLIDERVGVRELHPRIAEHNNKAALRQCLFHKIEQDTAVLPSRERNMKTIQLHSVLLINRDDLLHRCLLDQLQHLAILRNHTRNIHTDELRAFWKKQVAFLIRHQLNLRCGINIAALELCNHLPTVVVAIRLCPEIGQLILTCVLPIRIKSQNIQLGSIYRTRLLGHLRR